MKPLDLVLGGQIFGGLQWVSPFSIIKDAFQQWYFPNANSFLRRYGVRGFSLFRGPNGKSLMAPALRIHHQFAANALHVLLRLSW